jgi:hypothetical protein
MIFFGCFLFAEPAVIGTARQRDVGFGFVVVGAGSRARIVLKTKVELEDTVHVAGTCIAFLYGF